MKEQSYDDEMIAKTIEIAWEEIIEKYPDCWVALTSTGLRSVRSD